MQRHGRLIGTQIRGVESASAVMRRIIRSRDGRPCRRRLLHTPLPVRTALPWQQDRWPVQPIPSTLWPGLASNPSARACDHVQRWPQPLTSNYPVCLQIGTSLAWYQPKKAPTPFRRHQGGHSEAAASWLTACRPALPRPVVELERIRTKRSPMTDIDCPCVSKIERRV
jgi:hypothetical protein